MDATDNTLTLHLDASIHMHQLIALAEAAGCQLTTRPDTSLALTPRELHPGLTNLTDQELLRQLQARFYLAPLVKELVGRLESACDRILEVQDLFAELENKHVSTREEVRELEQQVETQREIIDAEHVA